MLAQQQSEAKTRKSSKPKRKASPETEAALLLLPFLHSVVTTWDDKLHNHCGKAKKNKEERKGSAGGTDSARLAIKVVFGDPALFDLDDAAFKNPWDILCGLLSKVFGGGDWSFSS